MGFTEIKIVSELHEDCGFAWNEHDVVSHVADDAIYGTEWSCPNE